MVKCKQCDKEFQPLAIEATRLYHANRAGFCSVECDKKWGRNYDLEISYKSNN